MDKFYMLNMLRKRIKVLEERYVKACSCKNEQDDDISEGAAAAIRTQSKRDIQILTLIEQLLIATPAVFIDNEDAVSGFNKLVAPTERYRRYR